MAFEPIGVTASASDAASRSSGTTVAPKNTASQEPIEEFNANPDSAPLLVGKPTDAATIALSQRNEVKENPGLVNGKLQEKLADGNQAGLAHAAYNLLASVGRGILGTGHPPTTLDAAKTGVVTVEPEAQALSAEDQAAAKALVTHAQTHLVNQAKAADDTAATKNLVSHLQNHLHTQAKAADDATAAAAIADEAATKNLIGNMQNYMRKLGVDAHAAAIRDGDVNSPELSASEKLLIEANAAQNARIAELEAQADAHVQHTMALTEKLESMGQKIGIRDISPQAWMAIAASGLAFPLFVLMCDKLAQKPAGT